MQARLTTLDESPRWSVDDHCIQHTRDRAWFVAAVEEAPVPLPADGAQLELEVLDLWVPLEQPEGLVEVRGIMLDS